MNQVIQALVAAHPYGYLVSTHYERLCLWKEWHVGQGHAWETSYDTEIVKLTGFTMLPADVPIYVNVGSFKYEGQLILSIVPTGRHSDAELIAGWVTRTFPTAGVKVIPETFHTLKFQIEQHPEFKS